MQPLPLNIRKSNHPARQWPKYLNSRFSREHLEMANKHMKSCARSLVIMRTPSLTLVSAE